jgi:hypothetical protein
MILLVSASHPTPSSAKEEGTKLLLLMMETKKEQRHLSSVSTNACILSNHDSAQERKWEIEMCKVTKVEGEGTEVW